MGIFDFLRSPDMNQGVKEWKNTQGSVLLDVRTIEEYRQGHVPGGINIPLDELNKVSSKVPKKDTPLFVHCLSGGRSSQAVHILRQMGYKTVKNIGGINRYHGKLEI